MLVLSRRLREKVVFPGLNLTVQVLAIQRGFVRLGIDAPLAVAVLREELVGKLPAAPAAAAPHAG
jgi:carbon storage regulator CsrA